LYSTDFLLFFVAGRLPLGQLLIWVNIPEVWGKLKALMANENVVDKLSILPDFSNKKALITPIYNSPGSTVVEFLVSWSRTQGWRFN